MLCGETLRGWGWVHTGAATIHLSKTPLFIPIFRLYPDTISRSQRALFRFLYFSLYPSLPSPTLSRIIPPNPTIPRRKTMNESGSILALARDRETTLNQELET